ncbi:PAS domain-containing sensor histidine kinase [Bradymonas sediminis]|uniref:PAS domain-containing sensor histidine kinase n=1 Tax=Bradymonas sediminis TaxID=1548548 RepID=UPI0013A6A630|nr:PAS domain-containing sensor histidine kinase [Bradymonas sediminis]
MAELDRSLHTLSEQGALILDPGFDNIIAHAVDGFVIHDTRGKILDFNQAACDMLGYSPEEFRTLSVADFERDLDPGAFWENMSVDEVFTVEGTHQRKDGSTYPVETRVGAFMNDGKKVCLALCRDITQRKEDERALKTLNAELKEASERARQANRAKSHFLANMNHELRTPLNAVIGYSEFLLEQMKDHGESRYIDDLERIHTSGRHLLALITHVLDLSKIEAGKIEISLSEFDVGAMLSDIATTAKPLADKEGNTLVNAVEGALPPMRSDQTKVRQILLNLLSNASKFTQNGEIGLRSRYDAASDAFYFEVYDNGMGMSEAEMAHVFGAYNQADASIAQKFGGTGLGLAISERFCEMLQGRIEVSSKLGEGTRFHVILPRQAEIPV